MRADFPIARYRANYALVQRSGIQTVSIARTTRHPTSVASTIKSKPSPLEQ
jgi:hypothetical protein